MKTITLIFCLMLCTSLCYGQTSNINKKTDLQEAGLKGKVKSVREINYDAVEKSGGPIKSVITRSYYTIYNNKGNKTEKNCYNSNDRLYQWVYKYDGKGNIIEWNNYDCDLSSLDIFFQNLDGDCLFRKIVYKYDDKGNKIEERKYNSDGRLDTKYTYKYDDKGTEIEKYKYYFGSSSVSFCDGKGNKIEDYYNPGDSSRCVYKYDGKGNIIEWNNYNSADSLRSKYVYKYDGKGNIIEWNNYGFAGSLENKTVYKYDDKGKQIEESFYVSDGRVGSKCVSKYDDKGSIIEHNVYDSDDSLDTKFVYKYDDKGNMIEQNQYDSDGLLGTNYKYKYDEHDNWIEAKEYKDEKLEYITERTIEYYK